MRQKRNFAGFRLWIMKKEARYLSRMHQKGWKFKRVTMPGIYTFEKCEPEKVIYQLDYNQEGMKTRWNMWRCLKTVAGVSSGICRIQLFQKTRSTDVQGRRDILRWWIETGYDEPDLPRKSILIDCDFLSCLVVNGYNAMVGHGGHVLASVFSILMILYIVIFLQFTLNTFHFGGR